MTVGRSEASGEAGRRGSPMRRIVALLSRREKRQIVCLAPALLLTGAADVVSLAAIVPFMSLLTDPSSLEKAGPTLTLYSHSPFQSRMSFFFFLGGVVLILLIISNTLHGLTTYGLLRFSWMRNHTLSSRLLEAYLYRPYEFFARQNTMDLATNILSEAQTVVTGMMIQGLLLISALTTALFLLVGLIFIDPLIAVLTGAFFVLMYGSLYTAIRRRLTRLGEQRSISQRTRFRLAAEVLASTKEAKLLGVEGVMLGKYRQPSIQLSRAMAAQSAWAQIPRFVLEVVAFANLIGIAWILLSRGADFARVASILGVYVFAAYRLLPGIQTIFGAVTSIRFSSAALSRIEDDLSRHNVLRPAQDVAPILPRSINVSNVTYRYPGSDVDVVQSVSFTIAQGDWVAIVGPTGSGKTTVADLLLGLLPPTDGTLEIDGRSVVGSDVVAWQRSAAYVPQTIFLLDDSIERNIAFGVDPRLIDHERVRRAAQTAQIAEFIEHDLPMGYASEVGERGVRLSGGERQRIGIARALYTDRPFLLLDEATSALDPSTEASFFAALRASHTDRTVVSIAHRHSTTLAFDRVILMVGGAVKQIGTPDDVINGRGMFASIHVRDSS